MRGGTVGTVPVARVGEHQGRWLVTLEGVDSMNDAETLRTSNSGFGSRASPLEPVRTHARPEGCEVTTESGIRIGL
jgi:hypothetical protein